MSILIKGIDMPSRIDLDLHDNHIVLGGVLYPIDIDQLLYIPNAFSVENLREIKGRNIWDTVNGHCEFKCSVCGADALVVEGGSLDGGYFKYCPNCGVELEEER